MDRRLLLLGLGETLLKAFGQPLLIPLAVTSLPAFGKTGAVPLLVGLDLQLRQLLLLLLLFG